MVKRGFFAHVNPEGDGPSERAAAAGYPFGAGENIAFNGEGSAFSLFAMWRSSAGHNMNMLNTDYEALGVGVAPNGGGAIGTQLFGLGPANTKDTGLRLYASSDKCAKAKLRLIKLKLLTKRKKGKATARERRRLKRTRARVQGRCKTA